MTFPWQRRAEIALLTALTLAALAVRAYRINEASLAEDEATKLEAVKEYHHGHFSGVNAEHPMLLKLLVWGSVELGDRLNRTSAVQPWPQGRAEVWLRLPSLLLGALTTVFVYLLGLELMGGEGAAGKLVGGLGAFFWAFTPIPIALNRVAKEDTSLTFFTLLAVYFYARAKHAPAEKARRWTDATGAAFGFALASKYIFHIFGLNALVWHVAGHEGIDRQPLGKYFWRMTAVMAAVFVLLNPVLLSPHNLLNALGYAKGAEVHHNGYNLDGQLYMNTAALTPYGVPWYFYAWVVAVKTPLAVFGALVGAALLLLGDRRSLSSIYFRVMVVIGLLCLSLMGAKWIRYMLPVVPFICLACGYAGQRLYARIARVPNAKMRVLGMAAAAAVLLVWPLSETLQWAPYYSLYLNALGGGKANVARFFPHDEIYDMGTQQAVRAVAEEAPPGATLAAGNPTAARFYLEEAGRTDVRLVPIYDVSYVPHSGDFLIVQKARLYFETYGLYDLVERAHMPYRDIRDGGFTTAQVYCFSACPQAETQGWHAGKAEVRKAAAARNRRSPE